jgi:hypothetical protein
MLMTDLAGAWDALHAATPRGRYVGRPSFHHERNEWQQYAFDPTERAVVGIRKREWTGVALTEAGVEAEARCLAEISARRVPK